MPGRLRRLSDVDRDAAVARLDSALGNGVAPQTDDVRAIVKHSLAVLAERFPGKSVEVRVPPFAAIQCVEGARHTRGTPPAVVETDGLTWIALARGLASFTEQVRVGRVRASGERSDLSERLPLL